MPAPQRREGARESQGTIEADPQLIGGARIVGNQGAPMCSESREQRRAPHVDRQWANHGTQRGREQLGVHRWAIGPTTNGLSAAGHTAIRAPGGFKCQSGALEEQPLFDGQGEAGGDHAAVIPLPEERELRIDSPAHRIGAHGTGRRVGQHCRSNGRGQHRGRLRERAEARGEPRERFLQAGG